MVDQVGDEAAESDPLVIDSVRLGDYLAVDGLASANFDAVVTVDIPKSVH